MGHMVNSEALERSCTSRMTDLNWPGDALPKPSPPRRRWHCPPRTFIVWFGALWGVGAAWVSEIAGGPHFFEVSLAMAVAAGLVLGAEIGSGRDGRLFGLAIMSGAVVVVVSASAAWFTLFFVPFPGGSGGAFEVIGLPLTILVAGVPTTVVVTALLGLAALLGLGWKKVRS